MKRKMKKFNEGGKTYDQETDGLFGGKIKYREDSEGRKFIAGKATPFERNPQEQRFYTRDDVKKGLSDVGEKISNFFGGKKETPKSVDSEPVGDANKSSSYNTRAKSEEEPRRQITDYIKKSEPEEPYKPTGKTVLNKEADIDEKPAKKVVAKKVVAKKEAAAPKVGTNTLDDKPAKYEDTKVNIGNQSFSPKPYKPGISKERQEKADKAVYAGWRKNKIDMTKRKSAEDMKYDEQGNAFKRGGSVRKSASARADGCAIRGKTRA